MACGRSYEPGDLYSCDSVNGIVLQTNENGAPTMLLSIEEASNINADAALQWAESLGNGWHLPDNEEMKIIKKYKSLINITAEREKISPVLTNHTFYWTSTPCSESHVNAFGPNGLRCYFRTNASPYYRARAVTAVEPQR